MIKKGLSFFCLLFVMCAVFAHGKNDVEERDVDNLNSWQEVFDLENKKPGKYNIMITATDLGGNVKVEGPHNLYIDPNSDLPVSGITNPYPNMRVVANLNIVGVCVDDDAVSYVELVLDGDTENPIRAEGKEFWSYYLDTNNMEEGPHTVQVTGYDINGLPGKPVSVTYQLDRNQPLTTVADREMGMLVSGNVEFQGTVEDGNGIKELFYSTDNCETFIPVKISNGKPLTNFKFNVNSKNFPDGPAVIWFKATDMSGSTGMYSFLYFIDNTKPDVQIVSPTVDEVVNGKITVAGFAKDTNGIVDLRWTFGEESGVIELIPGNPYWAVDLDTTNGKDKSKKFVIHAEDRAGNVVEVAQQINLNQELDKPVVTILSPVAAQSFGDDQDIVLRGIAKDDDGVVSVKYQLDSEEPVVQETKGVFDVVLLKGKDLTAGKHKVTVSAVDVNGVEGNPVTVEFNSLFTAPVFENPEVALGKEIVPFVNGIEIHPESGSSISVKSSSQVGIKSVYTKLSWGSDGVIENTKELKNVMNHTEILAINPDSPKGVVHYTVTVTDIADRNSSFKGIFYITNTNKLSRDEPIVVFDDSTVAEDGGIICNPEFPATGYFLGANAASVELVPSTPFAKAELEGNQIKLIPQNAIGSSAKVVVRVKTDKGKTFDSREIFFKNDNVLPEITINDYSDSFARVIDNEVDTNVVIKGKVKCQTGVGSLKYRILSTRVEIKNAVIASVKNNPIPDSYGDVEVNKDGSFELDINTVDFANGMYVVELVAESAGGNKSSKGVAFKLIPEIYEIKGKLPAVKPAVITWLDGGNNVYAVANYQGELDAEYKEFSREEMIEGSNPLEFGVTGEDGKLVSSKFTAQKAPSLDANIALVNDMPYMSGMPVVVPYGTKEGGKISVYIDTGAAVNSVSYEFVGDDIPGGAVKQNGAAKLIKPTEDNPTRWIAEIPVVNLPVRINKVNITVKAGSLEKNISGSVAVVRDYDVSTIDDSEKVFIQPDASVVYDSNANVYILRKDSKFYAYANVAGPITAEVVGAKDAFDVSVVGKMIEITPKVNATYSDVVIRVKDRFGDAYTSQKLNFMLDLSNPETVILTPEYKQWVGNTIKLSGTVADNLGVKLVEYSVDGGQTYYNFALSSGKNTNNKGITFSKDIDISSIEDGIVQIDIRATDMAGNIVKTYTSVYKDTTPPEVEVIEPLDTDIVNGETLIVFKARDNVQVAKSEYITPPKKGEQQKRTLIDLHPLTYVKVGTDENPIDDAMTVNFADLAGNVTKVEAWKFNIDNESDLPRVEIHVPEEMQVITRDFTISGVVYDDDGESTIFYKIDNGAYQQIPGKGTSFSIDVPLSTMTDNEHTVSVYAVDLNGVKGLESTRTFRISLEEPKGAVELPTIDTTVKEIVKISGYASDKNGIAKVQVSLDNGNSYNDAVGTENWSYTVDTRAIPGGTQVVFLKITDKYGIQGLYSSLINIDNDAPELSIELPLDDSSSTGQLFISGSNYDKVGVTDLFVTIRNLEKTSKAEKRNIRIDRIIGETIDLTNLENGFYNVEITAKDKAGNITNCSRNIHLNKNKAPVTVGILYPLNGEHKQGVFNIYGQSEAESEIDVLKLFIDDKFVSETTITDTGYFKFEVGPDLISEGTHTYHVDSVLKNGIKVSSREQTITYSPVGPWVTIDNFTYGDFATGRPYIRGQAGYSISEDELLYSKTKEATKEEKAAVAAKKVAKIELSFDNGKTFQVLSTSEKWMYRIENQDIPEGFHFFLVRATMENGETAITRCIIQIDNTSPNVRLISPAMGGRYNQNLDFSGLSNDDVQLEKVTLALRKGDKASYAVPAFIQGLYLDFHFWGASLFDIGAGLTFFDDNVRLQVQWGQFTQDQRDAVSGLFGLPSSDMRYGGNIFGLKLLANIFTLPFSFFFGRDWEWLSASFALGANFSLFTETNSGKPQFLSALLGQLEFPRVHLANMKAFSTFSFYTEGSLWFIPTDVSSQVEIQSIVPQIAVGIRLNIF